MHLHNEEINLRELKNIKAQNEPGGVSYRKQEEFSSKFDGIK